MRSMLVVQQAIAQWYSHHQYVITSKGIGRFLRVYRLHTISLHLPRVQLHSVIATSTTDPELTMYTVLCCVSGLPDSPIYKTIPTVLTYTRCNVHVQVCHAQQKYRHNSASSAIDLQFGKHGCNVAFDSKCSQAGPVITTVPSTQCHTTFC